MTKDEIQAALGAISEIYGQSPIFYDENGEEFLKPQLCRIRTSFYRTIRACLLSALDKAVAAVEQSGHSGATCNPDALRPIMTNDKLAEAISLYGDIFDKAPEVEHPIYDLVKAARSYHALPVVDESIRANLPEVNVSGKSYWHQLGWNACLDNLRATHPNGLVWKKEEE